MLKNSRLKAFILNCLNRLKKIWKNNTPYIKNVLGAISFLTIIQFVIYFSHPYNYEKINVISLQNIKDFNSAEYSEATRYYNVIDQIDLSNTLDSQYSIFLISPEDAPISNLKFYDLSLNENGEFDSTLRNDIKSINLEPQEYVAVKSPVADLYPLTKITFNINYKNGSYELAENHRNNVQDKVTLKVRKTFWSFFDK